MSIRKLKKLIIGTLLPFLNLQGHESNNDEFELRDNILNKENSINIGLDFEKVNNLFEKLSQEKINRDLFYINPQVEDNKIEFSDIDGLVIRVDLEAVKYPQPRNFMDIRN